MAHRRRENHARATCGHYMGAQSTTLPQRGAASLRRRVISTRATTAATAARLAEDVLTRSKATFKDSKTFVGERGHVVVTAPAQELTRRARQQSARWKCSGRGQEAGMLGPRGENPRASTAEVRGARTIMRASTQESAFARERRGAPSALSNELFHDRNRGTGDSDRV